MTKLKNLKCDKTQNIKKNLKKNLKCDKTKNSKFKKKTTQKLKM